MRVDRQRPRLLGRNVEGVSNEEGGTIETAFRSKTLAQLLINRALAGKADVVLATKRNPRGEIRGVIMARSA